MTLPSMIEAWRSHAAVIVGGHLLFVIGGLHKVRVLIVIPTK